LAVALGQWASGLAHRVFAMSTKLLGAHFDIHGGGQDLPVSASRERIAQSEGVLNRNDTQPFVKY